LRRLPDFKILIPATLLAILAVVVAALVSAPLHRRYSADECLSAYAKAATRTDTAHIDLRRYVPPKGVSADRRCGEVRAVVVDSAADLAKR
jgi:hypothetical protein